MLFHKKPEKRILELSRQEARLLREGLMHFRHNRFLLRKWLKTTCRSV